jgi:O-antigen biosynthesis protein
VSDVRRADSNVVSSTSTDQNGHLSESTLEDLSREAGRGFSPQSGHPWLWCEEPRIDAHLVVGRTIECRGWAIGSSGPPRVTVSFPGRPEIAARHGFTRQDVADALTEPGALESGWAAYVDVSDWPPACYCATISAHDPSGTATTLTRWVHVDPRERYAKWLAVRETDGIEPATDTAPCALSTYVIVDKHATEAEIECTLQSLASQSCPPSSTVVVSADAATGDAAGAKLDGVDGALEHLIEHNAEYGVLVAAGDVLEPHALSAIARAAGRYGPPDLIYADDDSLDADGVRSDPRFKPQWSPELLLSTDYIGPFLAVSRDAAGRARELETEPIRSVYDLLVRFVDQDVWVERIADVLCTRARRAPPLEDRATDAIQALAGRRRADVEVSAQGPGLRRVRWSVRGRPKVSIVIPTAFRDRRLIGCLESIREHSPTAGLEVVIVDSSADGIEAALPILQSFEHRVIRSDGPFNYSLANNAGAAAASGDYLVFLNDDIQIETPGWLELMLAHAQQPKVGIVGVKMIYWDGLVQHGGVLIAGEGSPARQLFKLYADDAPGVGTGQLAVVRNCCSVGTACAMMPRGIFDELEGFDPHLIVVLGDVDLGLRILNRNYRVVWTPEVVVRHWENGTRRPRRHPDDEGRFAQRWERVLRAGDPFYNPNLELAPNYEIRENPPTGPKRALAEARSPSDGPPTRPPMLIGIAEPSAERPSAERFVPLTMGRTLTEAEHQARYQWAAAAVAGRTVLDAGCGLGYGTAILAEAGAKRAIGVDLSDHAVADARALVGRHDVEYRVADLHQLPFDAGAFEVVVCFEAIEHMHDVETALDEFRRVLRPDGLLLISSPNRGVYPGGNPHHVHELTSEELEETLARRFGNVTLFRQHPWTASVIVDDRGFQSQDPGVAMDVSTRKTVAGELGKELYTLAAASDARIPALSGVGILTDPLEVGRLVHGSEDAARRAGTAMDEAERAKTRELEANQARDDARAEAASLRAQINALRASPSWRLTAPLRRGKRLVRRLRPPHASPPRTNQ